MTGSSSRCATRPPASEPGNNRAWAHRHARTHNLLGGDFLAGWGPQGLWCVRASRRAGRHIINLLLADDQDLVREGLRMIIDVDPELVVIGEARNGVEAISRTRELDPHVDLRTSARPTSTASRPTPTRRCRGARADRDATTFDLDEYVYRAMSAGATGFLLKDASREQLTSAIRTAASGGAMFAPAVTRRLIESSA